MLKSVLVATVVFIGSVASFAMDKQAGAEADAQVKQACSAEIATTGCADKSLGKGLMKCMYSYKKDHKDFKISDSCRDAKKKVKEMRREKKEAKAATSPAPATK